MPENNGSKSGTFTLTDKNTRLVRKALTRRADGTFDACEVHERRMRADSFDVVISADGNGNVEAQAVAHLTCGHSKKPCTETKRVIIADSTGINADLLKRIGLAEIEEEAKENAAA